MTGPPTITRTADTAAAHTTILMAFASDPMARWLYPSATAYLQHFPNFISALAGPAFDLGTTWQADDHAAAALWLPPGAESDGEQVMHHLEHSCPADKMEEMIGIATQMAENHPTYPHWYLVWLGADTHRQGEGLGARLIQHTLREVDAAGLPAYLESPNPRNIPFYQRHGFEVVGRTDTPTAPPIHFMLRQPRG